MPNNASFTPPDPIRVVPGVVLQDAPDSVEAATRMHNWLVSHYRAHTVVNQGWPDGAFSVPAMTPKTLGPTWPIPTLTDQHTQVRITIDVTVAGLGAVVTFTADSSVAAVVGAAVGPGVTEVVLPLLTVNPAAVLFETVALSVETNLTGSAVISDVRIEYVPLASPLLAETVDGAQPLGETQAGDDSPMASARLFAHLQALTPIRQRPRVLHNVSGLGALGNVALPEERLLQSVARTWSGAFADGVTYRAIAYVNNAGGGAASIYWQIGDPRARLNANNPVDVAAGFIGYKILSVTIPEGVFIDGFPRSAARLALQIDTDGARLGETTAAVRRLAIWGE